MQQPTTRREVTSPGVGVKIGGRSLDAASMSMDREMPDPALGDALRAASGSIVAVEGPDVTDTIATPWDPGTQWPPVPQAPASITLDTGSGPVSILQGGRVVSATGGTGGREVQVDVSDQYQSLERTISWDPVPAAVPSLEERGQSRYVSMLTSSIVDMILRECGWFTTPPRLPYVVLSVPAMGTMWPEDGTVTACGRESDVNYGGFPAWPTTSWGMAVDDCRADYTLGGSYSVKNRGRMELTAMTGVASDGRIEVSDATGLGIARLIWTSSTAYIQVRGLDGAFVTAVSVPRAEGFLYGTIRYAADTAVEVIIRSGGVSNSATAAVQSVMTTSIAGRARIIATGPAGGFQVAFPSTSGAITFWTPNAVQYVRTSQRNNLMIRKDEQGVNCADFLQRICKAEAATYWIDETGVLRWWDLTRLEARSTVATLTSADDITEDGFEWDHSLASLKSRVAISWQEPLRTWSWTTSVDLHQGSGSTAQAGETNEDWINVPNDEVWVMPDTSMERAPGTGTNIDFNYGWGSWYGGRMNRGDGIDTWVQLAGEGSFLMALEQVTPRAFKITTQWTGSQPVIQKSISYETGGSVWRARRDTDLPIIRGKGKYKFTELLTYSTQTGDPTAPEFTVDADWLIQYPDQAAYTANYYGQRVTIPQPILSSITLAAVPGLQIGDMVEAQAPDVARLLIRGVIIADSRSIRAGMDIQHSVAIRPVAVTRTGVTWEEWGASMNGRTWETWGGQQQPKTWEQWGQDPLEGEED